MAYSANDLDNKKEEKLANILAEDISVWLEGVKMTLQEFGETELLPRRILLCGGGSLLPEMKQALEDEEWTKGLAFSKRPQVEFIQPGQVKTIIDETGTLNSPLDITSMALANLTIEIIEGISPMTEMLRNAGGGATQ